MGRLSDRFGVTVPLIVGACGIGAGFWLAAADIELRRLQRRARAAARVARRLGDVLAAGRGHVALVREATRHRRGHLRERQLPGRGRMAADRPALGGSVGVAADVFRGMGHRVLRGDHRVVAPHAQASAGRFGELDARGGRRSEHPFGMSRMSAQVLLCIAGLACCVAMAMPQVHIVAYCGDLGYGVARGAEMLAVMLAFGIVSRLVSGWICDHIGGLRTLLLGSALQGVALLLFLPFDGLVSLFVISALFGLFQGGIVPSYAIIVREHFPASEVGARVGAVIMFTLIAWRWAAGCRGRCSTSPVPITRRS
jgi:hypothetical protein